MTSMTAKGSDDATVHLLFDVYTSNGKSMSRDTLVQVLRAFSDEASLQQVEARKVKSLSKQEFVAFIQDVGIDPTIFKQLATLIYVELGLKPADSAHERRLIQSMMDVDYK